MNFDPDSKLFFVNSNPKSASAHLVQHRCFLHKMGTLKQTNEESEWLGQMCRLIWVFTVRKWFKTHATLTIIDTYFIISLIKFFDLDFFKYCLMLFSRSNSIPTNIIGPLNVISRAVLLPTITMHFGIRNSEYRIRNAEWGIQNSEFRIRNCEKVWKWNVSQLGHRAYIFCAIVQYGFCHASSTNITW